MQAAVADVAGTHISYLMALIGFVPVCAYGGVMWYIRCQKYNGGLTIWQLKVSYFREFVVDLLNLYGKLIPDCSLPFFPSPIFHSPQPRPKTCTILPRTLSRARSSRSKSSWRMPSEIESLHRGKKRKDETNGYQGEFGKPLCLGTVFAVPRNSV